THRCVRRGHPHVVVLAPDLFLSLGVEEGELPRVDTDDAGDPARRAVECAEGHDGFGCFTRMAFESAVFLRLEGADDARVAQAFRGRIGEAHELVALGTFGADLLRVLHDPVQYLAHDGDSSWNRLLTSRVCGEGCAPPNG